MTSDQMRWYRGFYGRLISLYPRSFREQLGESMEQTFTDLCNERRRQSAGKRIGFLLWMFAETLLGVLKERAAQLTQGIVGGGTMMTSSRPAAIISFALSLPIVLSYGILVYEIAPLQGALTRLFTVDGQQINDLGRVFFLGGLLLLPVAFVLNLLPVFRRSGQQRRIALHPINLLLGVAIAFFLVQTWGGLILEEITCLSGVPNCD